MINNIPSIISKNSRITLLDDEARLNLKYIPYGNVLINKTASEIYNYCDGSNTISEIVDKLAHKYKMIPYKKIEIDVISIIREFYNMGIIRWINEYYFKNDKVYENNISKIKIVWVDTIDIEKEKKYQNVLISPYISEELYYKSDGLPYKIFNGEQMMLVYNNKNNSDEIQILISFDRSDNLLTINCLKFNYLHPETFNDLFPMIENIIKINRNMEDVSIDYLFYVDSLSSVDI